MSTSRLAQIALVAACVSAALFLGGPLLVQLGALSPFVGFRLFGLGFLVGALALLLGLLSLWTTRPASGRAGRGGALAATLVGVVVVGSVLALAAPTSDLPMINDITTDPVDPPQFRAEHAGRDMGYPDGFAAQQAEGYGEIAPIRLGAPPARAHAVVADAIRDLGWEIVREDPAGGEIEATETTGVFRFVDDVAVRIRPDGAGGSRVDVRSKSRDGKGDLGANAARIERLRDALR